MKNKRQLLLALSIIIFSAASLFAWQYPESTGFSKVPVIGTEELYKQIQSGKKILIVDVRSTPEYDTAHLKGAIHIKVSNRNFVKLIKEEVAKVKPEIVVTYCNGLTCLKAPKAADIAIKAGVKHVKSYYGGLPGWAEAHPDLTILRGKPVGPGNQLISKADFKKKCLSFDAFKAKAQENGTLVIDVRDAIQSSGKLPLGKTKVLSIPLDRFIPNFVMKGKEKDKTLLIFDQVGKQVQALEYDLKANGYKNYYFLDKGATKVLGKQKYK